MASSAQLVESDQQLELGFESHEGIAEVFSILPPCRGEQDLATFDAIVLAQQDLSLVHHTAAEEEINVVMDEEVDDQVTEILGNRVNLGFDVSDAQVQHSMVVLHVKNMKKFFWFHIRVEDVEGRQYEIRVTNRQSAMRVKNTMCSMPLQLTRGWNRLCIDLKDVMARAWDKEFGAVLAVRIFANCRIWRLFFQEKDYADCQLPSYLRVNDD